MAGWAAAEEAGLKEAAEADGILEEAAVAVDGLAAEVAGSLREEATSQEDSVEVAGNPQVRDHALGWAFCRS